MLNEPSGREKIFQLISGPYGLSLKLKFCHFKVNSSPPNIRQQTEHLLHKYKLNDKTLQKVQLKQHKIFQNFPTNPIPATPNAPPLPTGATPKVSTLLEPNNSDNDSPETPFDTKTGNTFLDNNDKSLTQTHICKKLALTCSPLRQRLSELLALQSQVSEADGFAITSV